MKGAREVHYEHGAPRKRHESDPLVTVCKPSPWPGSLGSVLRTGLPRLVTCPACLDWIAVHYRDVIAAVEKLRTAA